MNWNICFIIWIFLLNTFIGAQQADDILLFSIDLNDDTTSIYGCQWNDKVKSSLAGPVIMKEKNLLFYSQNGYVLYSQKGRLLDSYSLFKLNKKASKSGEKLMRLAYPLDSSTILFYKESLGGYQSPEIFHKQLFKKEMKKANTEDYGIYAEINTAHLFNLANNSITDELGTKSYLKPFLVGYTSLKDGLKWWTIDRFFSFTSPLVIEKNGGFISFFPGLKADQECEVEKHLIDPLGSFCMDGRWYYYGLYSSKGNLNDEYYQVTLVCDQAGNILFTNRLLKEEITDAELQKVEASNTIFTVRQAIRHVFVPAVDDNGNIYYGMIDFERKKIDVYKRFLLKYKPVVCGPVLQNLFKIENDYAFNPINIDCNPSSEKGVNPEISHLTDDGFKLMGLNETVKEGYFVTIHRHTDGELQKKLYRLQSSLSDTVKRLLDSVNHTSTSWCPYCIVLNHKEAGPLNLFYYGMGDEVECARVITVAPKVVYVRVDLENWAEMLVFDRHGKYLNRFTFNQQNYRDRKDVIVASDKKELVEKDFENDKNSFKYFRWELSKVED